MNTIKTIFRPKLTDAHLKTLIFLAVFSTSENFYNLPTNQSKYRSNNHIRKFEACISQFAWKIRQILKEVLPTDTFPSVLPLRKIFMVSVVIQVYISAHTVSPVLYSVVLYLGWYSIFNPTISLYKGSAWFLFKNVYLST